jgi:hypothetical protein
MAKKSTSNSRKTPASGKPSSLIDTRVIYCGDNLDQLKKFPDGCVDLIYIDPPVNIWSDLWHYIQDEYQDIAGKAATVCSIMRLSAQDGKVRYFCRSKN